MPSSFLLKHDILSFDLLSCVQSFKGVKELLRPILSVLGAERLESQILSHFNICRSVVNEESLLWQNTFFRNDFLKHFTVRLHHLHLEAHV